MKVYYGKDRSKVMLVSEDDSEIIFVDSKTDQEVRMKKEDYDLINRSFRDDDFKIDLSKISISASTIPWSAFPSSHIVTSDVEPVITTSTSSKNYKITNGKSITPTYETDFCN